MNNKYLLFICFSFLFSGCTKEAPPASLKNSSHSEGINRIISTAPSITEIIAGLDLGNKLIAVDKYSRDIKGIKENLKEIDFFSPDIEAISALNPDIIITGEINTNGSADTPYQFFQKLGIKVIQLPTSNSIEDIYRDIITIAEALGVTERGQELVKQTRGQIERIAGKTGTDNNSAGSGRSAVNKKTVYFEIAPAPNIVSFGRGTYLNELIEIAGAKNIFTAEERWFTPGPEAIVSANPDVIFILNGVSNIAEIKNRPGFRNLTAVQNNRIYAINADSASRPSQNIVLALEEICQKLMQK